MKFFISHDGEYAAGIAGDVATLHISVDRLEGDERKEYVEEIRKQLMRAFMRLWDVPVIVVTDEETPNGD